MRKTIMAAVAAGVAMTATAQDSKLTYPKTAKVDTVDVYFGERVPDPYRWLENDTSRATARWVEAQNRVTQGYLSRIPFRDKLFKRMTSYMNYERMGVPFKQGGKYYFFRNDGLQNQSVLYVQDTPGAAPRVFLDPNRLSADGTVALSGYSFSNDGKYFAYSVSRSGSDWQEIYVLDAATGRQLDDHILWSKFAGITWHGDGFYYGTYDHSGNGKEYSDINENHKLRYHRVGTAQSDDNLFYSDPSLPQAFFSVFVPKEEDVMVLYKDFGSGNTLHLKDLRKPGSDFVLMTGDKNHWNNIIDAVGGEIYILTTDGASNGRIMAASVDRPAKKDWRVVVPESENVISNANIIGGKLVVVYGKDACDHACLYSLDGRRLNDISLPALGSVTFSGTKDDKECFFSLKSFTIPGTIYRYDTDRNASGLYYTPKLPFNTDDYTTEQVFFTSKDGTRVPMFLTHKKGITLDGNNPVLLYGYGGFAISLNPTFSATRMPFIESGGILVTVNLRGGSEYGEDWHQAGTKMRKQNVFDDFIAAAEYLVANKYTNPSRIAIEGGSNGGLLVGACMAQRPDLFKAVSAHVGVMDMLRYHKFTIGWNWAGDYGTSEDSKEMFSYLKAYSPLHALRPGVSYPATLVLTADHDDRVVPAHSFKFAARLQECNAGSATTLIRIDSKAGHGGGKPMGKVIEEAVDNYSFIMYNLGMDF